MNRLSTRSNCKTAAAALLVLVMLARMPFAHGLLLHDHGDDGLHSHALTADDMRDVNLHTAWHRHNDDDRDDRSSDSDGDEYGDSLCIFLNNPSATLGIHCSSSTAIASIRHLSSRALPRSMLPSDPTAASRIWIAPWPSAQPLRPANALDALLQTSHALLL